MRLLSFLRYGHALFLFSLAGLAVFFSLFSVASAHEVYVLEKEMVLASMNEPSLPIFDIISGNAGQFFFWMFITVWAIFTVLSISLAKPLERIFGRFFDSLKHYAPVVGRVTLGIAIIASGQFGALFGPELAFGDFLPPELIPYLKTLLIGLGTLITFGLFTRIAGLTLCLIYGLMWFKYGFYMLTYANYFGEMLLAIIVGNTSHALDRLFHHLYPHFLHRLVSWMHHHAFLLLRITFGVSLIYASFYAKFLHASLAMNTVIEYRLTEYFPFDPAFVVLGAFAIEMLLGLFILLGIEVRFASLFLLFWLALSLLYFGEAVWPHVILAGTGLAIFMRGYDKYTLEFRFLRRLNRHAREPVL
jgi:uncharacterized membrane protein YphA (DoxX/SURF4 family)